jgi:hypothetical protein
MNTSHLRSGGHGPDIVIVKTPTGIQPHLAFRDDPYVTFCSVETFGLSRT